MSRQAQVSRMLQEAVGKRLASAPGEGVWRTSCRMIPKLSVGLVSAVLGFTLVFGGAGARSALAQEATLIEIGRASCRERV